MAVVTMRYWAAAKDAAGVAEEIVTADTLAAALQVIRGRRPADRFSGVLSRSSFLVDGHPVGTRAADGVQLADGNVIEVLPPFAGG
jgi:molybdopterin synthase sulfur carrier subunit